MKKKKSKKETETEKLNHLYEQLDEDDQKLIDDNIKRLTNKNLRQDIIDACDKNPLKFDHTFKTKHIDEVFQNKISKVFERSFKKSFAVYLFCADIGDQITQKGLPVWFDLEKSGEFINKILEIESLVDVLEETKLKEEIKNEIVLREIDSRFGTAVEEKGKNQANKRKEDLFRKTLLEEVRGLTVALGRVKK